MREAGICVLRQPRVLLECVLVLGLDQQLHEPVDRHLPKGRHLCVKTGICKLRQVSACEGKHLCVEAGVFMVKQARVLLERVQHTCLALALVLSLEQQLYKPVDRHLPHTGLLRQASVCLRQVSEC